MRRILVLLTVAALTAVMMTFSAVPAFAQETEFKDDKTEFGDDFFGVAFGVGTEVKDDKVEWAPGALFCPAGGEFKEDKAEPEGASCPDIVG
jgi:hypothetical protein